MAAVADPVYIVSSSPSLPSPRALASRVKIGSRAQQVPLGAAHGFSTASALYEFQAKSPMQAAENGKQLEKPAKRKKAIKVIHDTPLNGGEKTKPIDAQPHASAPSKLDKKVREKRTPKSAAIILNSDEPEASAYFTATGLQSKLTTLGSQT